MLKDLQGSLVHTAENSNKIYFPSKKFSALILKRKLHCFQVLKNYSLCKKYNINESNTSLLKSSYFY